MNTKHAVDTFYQDTQAMNTLVLHLQQALRTDRFIVGRTASRHVLARGYYKLATDRYVQINLDENNDGIAVKTTLLVQRHHVGPIVDDPDARIVAYFSWDADATRKTTVDTSDVLATVRESIDVLSSI